MPANNYVLERPNDQEKLQQKRMNFRRKNGKSLPINYVQSESEKKEKNGVTIISMGSGYVGMADVNNMGISEGRPFMGRTQGRRKVGPRGKPSVVSDRAIDVMAEDNESRTRAVIQIIGRSRGF